MQRTDFYERMSFAGGVVVGLATHRFFPGQGHFMKQALKNTEDLTGKAFHKLVSGTVVTWRLAKRAAIGALLFDGLKRNAEMVHKSKTQKKINYF
jgi:hypothetical protein